MEIYAKMEKIIYRTWQAVREFHLSQLSCRHLYGIYNDPDIAPSDYTH